MRLFRSMKWVVWLLVTCAVIAGCRREKTEEVLGADSKDLKHTIITAHLEEKIVPGKNLIYCSTFQLAWNELRDNIIGEDIRLDNENWPHAGMNAGMGMSQKRSGKGTGFPAPL